MEIDEDRFSQFVGEFREFRGEVRATNENMASHLQAVSKKADKISDKLDSHSGDINAHGAGARQGETKNWRSQINMGIGLVTLIVLLWGFVRGMPR